VFTDATAASDGDGTMTITPTNLCSGSTGNGLTFTFRNNTINDF
jgi:hypothetical protein